jgi:triphosphoribosyl-dephospho-CoA synthase
LLKAYLEACEIELRAFKPGNVSIYSETHDMTVEDFRRSAAASGPYLTDEKRSLGEKIFYAIETTRAVVACNTNLGIVLLAAPLFQAFHLARQTGVHLHSALATVLNGTTQNDAEWVYRAIRLAQPGGLGEMTAQDVRNSPNVKLLDAMRLAENRDRIAYQYVNCYRDIFDFAIPRYHNALSRWDSEEWAAVMIFVGLLKEIPDSHIERKFGTRFSRMVANRMIQIEQVLLDSDRVELVMPLLREVDTEFKSGGINPGTTADLTVTCLLVARLMALLSHASRGRSLT